jgi:hypothetical protein
VPQAVAKFVPKTPGAQREMLVVDLKDVRNVIPIIDNGMGFHIRWRRERGSNKWYVYMFIAERRSGR